MPNRIIIVLQQGCVYKTAVPRRIAILLTVVAVAV